MQGSPAFSKTGASSCDTRLIEGCMIYGKKAHLSKWHLVLPHTNNIPLNKKHLPPQSTLPFNLRKVNVFKVQQHIIIHTLKSGSSQ